MITIKPFIFPVLIILLSVFYFPLYVSSTFGFMVSLFYILKYRKGGGDNELFASIALFNISKISTLSFLFSIILFMIADKTISSNDHDYLSKIENGVLFIISLWFTFKVSEILSKYSFGRLHELKDVLYVANKTIYIGANVPKKIVDFLDKKYEKE